jgi:hypothetical protein
MTLTQKCDPEKAALFQVYFLVPMQSVHVSSLLLLELLMARDPRDFFLALKQHATQLNSCATES